MGITLKVKSAMRNVCNLDTIEKFKEAVDKIFPEKEYLVILDVPALVGESFEVSEIPRLKKEMAVIKKKLGKDEVFKDTVETFEWAIKRAEKFKCKITYA